jgi:two-component system sensor histidine kinase ChvG
VKRLARLRRALSGISVRLLAFNVLLVFLPLAALLYLDVFEEQLLMAQERSMVQQGRVLAAALAAADPPTGERSREILVQLDRRLTARLRVVDASGRLLADTSRLGPRAESVDPEELVPPDPRRSWLYRVGSSLFRLVAPLVGSAPTPSSAEDFYPPGVPILGPEVRAALAGRYGAATRVSPGQRSLTLYSAIPVRGEGEVQAVVLVSQSTYRLLQDLYEERLAIFQVVLLSVGVAAVLTLLVSTTIARPIRRLRSEASALLDRRGRLRGHFRGSTRRDEIGDLARALEELSTRLRSRVGFIESLSADVSHAFKNPLAAIRAAAELAIGSDDPAERARYAAMVAEDVARLERLLSTLREVTAIDAELPEEATAVQPLGSLLEGLLAGFRLRYTAVRFSSTFSPEPLPVVGSGERLAQAFENLIDNAASLAPEGSEIEVHAAREGDGVRVRIEDRGPGIPAEHLDRIFDRFFSYRPAETAPEQRHTGLGLAIARAIVEGCGGSVQASNRPGGGACLEVRLPLAEG